MDRIYRAALVGCSRMGAFIDNEVVGTGYVVHPWSHAAGYKACPRTELVAGTDLRPDVLQQFGERYAVSGEHLYADYRELIERERPAILSIATQPEQRAEIAIFAAEHGVKALYCEKALCASLAEADAMVEVVERHGVAFNMGTNRRWDPGFDRMREMIASGELGALRTLVLYGSYELFNNASHAFDVAQRLNGDEPVTWAQGFLPNGPRDVVGDAVVEDPRAEGMFGFANGVTVYAMNSPRRGEYEAICEGGTITACNNDTEFRLRRTREHGTAARTVRTLVDAPFPPCTRASRTLRLIEDLVNALDTGAPTRGGIRVARANTEIIFGFIESYRRGGVRLALPLRDCPLRLNRTGRGPKQPLYDPAAARA